METYNVTFILAHAVVTIAVATEATEDEYIAKAAEKLLALDGIDFSKANVQDYTVEML